MELETYTGSTMYTQKYFKISFAILTWNNPFSKQNKYISDKALAPHSTSLTSIKRNGDNCIPNGPGCVFNFLNHMLAGLPTTACCVCHGLCPVHSTLTHTWCSFRNIHRQKCSGG